MKKLLYTLICAIFIPALVNAAPLNLDDSMKQLNSSKHYQLKDNSIFLKADTQPGIFGETKYNNNIPLTSIKGWGSNFVFTGTPYPGSMIHYLPDAQAVLVSNLEIDINTDNNKDYGEIQIYPFYDKGLSFDSANIYSLLHTADTIVGFVTFGVTNPIPGNTDAKMFNYVLYGGGHYTKSNEYKFISDILFGVDPSNLVNDKPKIQLMKGSTLEPSNGANYALPLGMKINGFLDEGKSSYFAFYQALLKENSQAPMGYYHMSLIDNTDNLSYYVQELFNKDVKAPSAEGYYSTKPLSDYYNGNIYAGAILNFLLPAENEPFKLPGIAKSDNGGYSFGDFDKMPVNILNDYVLSIVPEQYTLNDLDYGFAAFRESSMTVYGDDKLSILTRFYIQVKADRKYLDYSLVEISKDGSNWKIRKIDEFLSSVFDDQISAYRVVPSSSMYYLRKESNKEILGMKNTTLFLSSSRANESEIAKTEDGQYLVAKWIDDNYDAENPFQGYKNYKDKEIKLAKPFSMVYEDSNNELATGTISEVSTNNIFISYRKIDEDKWSKPMNVTKFDNTVIMHSFMPKIVPSIHNIPLLFTIPIPLADINFSDSGKEIYKDLINADPLVQAMLGTEFRRIVYCTYNYDEKTSVDSPIQLSNDISVYPNPANSEISINLNEISAASEIEVFNTLGEKVMSFQSNSADTRANVSTLGNGMYIIKVKDAKGLEHSTSFTIAR